MHPSCDCFLESFTAWDSIFSGQAIRCCNQNAIAEPIKIFSGDQVMQGMGVLGVVGSTITNLIFVQPAFAAFPLDDEIK